MPHHARLHLPSGARAHSRVLDLLPDMGSVPGFHDEFLTRHNEQRYLLQLGYTDRLLGRLIRRLKREGIYDETLLVVTADHGVAFQVGVQSQRSVTPSNVEELTPVPFFVKRPGQRRGRVSEAYARTLDVTPTIAGVLGFRLGYRADGRSAFSPAVRRRRSVWLSSRDFSSTVRISGRRWQARRRAVVRRRLGDFGSGDWASLYTGIGPNQALIGRSTASLSRAASEARVRASILEDALFADVGGVPGVVPTEIVGDLHGGQAGEKRELAVAVNGRVEAVGRSFYLVGDPVEHFAFNVPESAFHDGRNSVEVFEVLGGDRLRAPTLRAVSGARLPTRSRAR